MSKRLQERKRPRSPRTTDHARPHATAHRAHGAPPHLHPTHTAQPERRGPARAAHGLSLSAVSGLARLSALPIAILRSRCERAESRETYKRRNSYKTYNTYSVHAGYTSTGRTADPLDHDIRIPGGVSDFR